MRLRIYSLLMAMILAGSSGVSLAENPGHTALWLDIENGDTAFVLDLKRKKAWWVVDQCRREILIAKNSDKSVLLSKSIEKNVQIGVHQILLKQKFRFTLNDLRGTNSTSVKVDVYNSVRGG